MSFATYITSLAVVIFNDCGVGCYVETIRHVVRVLDKLEVNEAEREVSLTDSCMRPSMQEALVV